MHPDLVKLLDLQAKDLALLEADAALAEILAAEAELDARLARLAKESEAAARGAQEARRRRDESQKKIDTWRAQQEKRQQRLDTVRNAREATAVMAELDLAKQVLQREEGDWVALAAGAEAAEARQAELEAALADARAAQAGEREALAARRAAAEGQRADALAAREASAGELERTLRVRYDRLRKARAPKLPLVPLANFTCSACFTAVPVSRRAAIRGRLLIEGCEVCGVILYQPEESA